MAVHLLHLLNLLIHQMTIRSATMKTQTQTTVTINGMTVAVEGERNLLEVIRKAKVDLPTFCYHSELSIYGACRLCLVDLGRVIAGFQQGARRSECSGCDGRVPEFRSIWSSSTGSCVDHFRAEGLHDLIASPDAGLSDAGDDELL